MKFTDFKIVPNSGDFHPFELSHKVVTVTASLDGNSVSIVFKDNKVEACSLTVVDKGYEEFIDESKSFLGM
ncbi:hypothetical protein G4923_09295 [Aeromonas rivipollensis]|uniref:Uncharacterized protein n=1 Tax=Aeromonas rivipollensis TaxID=948519 RepID=A0ABX0D4Z6_9GAMM|nr:hypothetical protein [Aeromonas rivipollensis]NEX88898.1 hypothetical protein [Aeromonas rivipollensis]NEY04637.1 hypothetical protein [Aeromonas rivipollensis]